MINKILLLCIFTASSLFTCGQKESGSKDQDNQVVAKIPFTLDINRLIVRGKINGQGDYSFIFDTGAQGVVLNESVANSLDLKGEGYTAIGSPNNPNAVQAKNIDIPLLTIVGIDSKEFDSRNEEAVSVDFAKVFSGSKHDGIFGLSTFRGHLVTINYAESMLVVSKGSLAGDADAVKADLSRILALTAKMNGKEVPVHFDSGSPLLVSIPYEWKADMKFKEEPVQFAKARTASGEFDLHKGQMIGQIQVGSVVLDDPEVVLKSGGFTAMNFGYEFLKKYILTIDMVNSLVRLEESKETSAKKPKSKSEFDCSSYAGDYGNRKVTCENGELYSQRIITEADQRPGQQIHAPKMKMISEGKDAFRLEQIASAKIKFLVDASGQAVEMHVLNPQGQWEVSKRNK